MNYRKLGKTGFDVSEISLGTWQVGGRWGSGFDQKGADRIINEAIDGGVNFIDTADVYENGKSETAVGRVVRSRSERIYVATKCGRRISPHVNENFRPEVLQKFVEDSLKRLGLETLDLIQLHCPPVEVYYRPEIFEMFERLQSQGKIRNLGVSVEKVEEGLKAIEYENVTTVQVIFNVFRQRPADLFFKEASRKNVGIIVRVPLASGLLTGKYDAGTRFEAGDHRQFNRNGESFDRGETFSGVDYDRGLTAVAELKKVFPKDLALWALRWVLMFDEVSVVIPGASRRELAEANVRASDLPPLSEAQMNRVREIYDEFIKPEVHQRW